jgi:hypothetical protein
MCAGCSEPSAPFTTKPLTAAQDKVLSEFTAVWSDVNVYDVDSMLGDHVLLVGFKADKLNITLVASDGCRHRVTDLLNQSHWLNDVAAGRFPMVVEAASTKEELSKLLFGV